MSASGDLGRWCPEKVMVNSLYSLSIWGSLLGWQQSSQGSFAWMSRWVLDRWHLNQAEPAARRTIVTIVLSVLWELSFDLGVRMLLILQSSSVLLAWSDSCECWALWLQVLQATPSSKDWSHQPFSSAIEFLLQHLRSFSHFSWLQAWTCTISWLACLPWYAHCSTCSLVAQARVSFFRRMMLLSLTDAETSLTQS